MSSQNNRQSARHARPHLPSPPLSLSITLSDMENYNLHDEFIHSKIIPYLTPYQKFVLFFEYITRKFSSIVNMKDFKEKLKLIFTCKLNFNTMELITRSGILLVDSQIQLLKSPETKKINGCIYVLMYEPRNNFNLNNYNNNFLESDTYYILYDRFEKWNIWNVYVDEDYLFSNSNIKNIIFYGFNTIIDNSNSHSLGFRQISFHGMTSVEKIKDHFLRSTCSKIDFTGLHNVTSIGDLFMFDCDIKTVRFNGLTNVKSIGDHWLSRCVMLENVSFEGLTDLTSIGDEFMSECTRIKNIKFNGLTNVKSIGNNWLSDCASLANVSFEGLTNLHFIGSQWMNECPSLTNINFKDLENIRVIGRKAINSKRTNNNLTRGRISNVKNLSNDKYLLDDDNFMLGVPEPLRNDIIRIIAEQQRT